MTPRNTRTGGVLEQMVVPALDQGGYAYKVQVNIGQRLGCGQHFDDVIAEKDRHRIRHSGGENSNATVALLTGARLDGHVPTCANAGSTAGCVKTGA